MVDVVIASLLDTFKELRQHKVLVSIGYCIICYLLALPMCAPVKCSVKRCVHFLFFV